MSWPHEPRKVVWVLGSGFSKSLGGPLLNELFDRIRLERICNHEPMGRFRGEWQRILDVFHRVDDKANAGSLPWTNAEDYVEFLELAAQGQPQAQKFVVDLFGESKTSAEIAHEARNYLRAATHVFLESANVAMERWSPYRRWAQLLGAKDEVVTFNYDLVVETAHNSQAKTPIKVSTPTEPGVLHKVHGSVDWIRHNMGIATAHEPFWSIANGHESAIGVPGPNNQDTSNNLFKPIWDRALDSLRTADAIVFVGYSSPQTDAFARQQVLKAIAENTRPALTIRLVLGPERSKEVNRLEGMLRWVLTKRPEVKPGHALQDPLRQTAFVLIHEPMYAEDFLSVFERSDLGGIKLPPQP